MHLMESTQNSIQHIADATPHKHLMSNYVEHYRVLLRKKLQLLLGSIQHPE
jgi:hypothetical protein